MKELIPGLLTTEIVSGSSVDLVLDGQRLPFAAASLRAVVMTNVLHHLPRVQHFFSEAQRCLRPGGAVVMLEPWVTPWSRLVYRLLHHEPFDPGAKTWAFVSRGPICGANTALPWVILARDRDRFDAAFPGLLVRRISPIMPFCYLISGGLSIRNLAPGWSYGIWRTLERGLGRFESRLALFALVVIEKRG